MPDKCCSTSYAECSYIVLLKWSAVKPLTYNCLQQSLTPSTTYNAHWHNIFYFSQYLHCYIKKRIAVLFHLSAFLLLCLADYTCTYSKSVPSLQWSKCSFSTTVRVFLQDNSLSVPSTCYSFVQLWSVVWYCSTFFANIHFSVILHLIMFVVFISCSFTSSFISLCYFCLFVLS